ncbi:MAG: hypothetical protein COT21_03385 [Hadesarchaea archaeon CG08_land_8_20_14_0_20_51_8]|jgi:DNA-binding MarR family transcriptional regulator|nr:MAG: hypothetical protein COT21_03385 [Hadesarchaea archaeon CG08_land_8_20_14_0_20_51_8]
MGVQEEITWLKDDPDRIAVFISLGKLGQATIRSLKDDMSIDDWWPVKYHVDNLVKRGLVNLKDGSYELAKDIGEKVFKGLESEKFMGKEIKAV